MSQKENDNHLISIPSLLLVAGQLALGLWVMFLFEFEPIGKVDGWGAAGIIGVPVGLFVVHALLPLGLRKPMMLVAFAALLFALSGSVTTVVFVIGGGLLLIGLCHLPVPLRLRFLLVVAVAVGFALVHGQVVSGSRYLVAALPFLGAIFLFRLIIYFYDVRYEKPGTASIWDRLGYFFLPPAPLFFFFPALDYQAYLQCYYSRPAFSIYQTGVLWISRGIVHLGLYRIIYHFHSPPPEYVVDFPSFVSYCLAGYMIYLRVSGVFHIICGLLRIFGYDVSDTHRLYFFAKDFSDYWRRINIYWKDFMAKIFFFPTAVAMRRLKAGPNAQLFVAVIVVFLATTLLHAYQFFWIAGGADSGSWQIRETDFIFWSVLCVCVLINSFIEKRKPAAEQDDTFTWRGAVVTSVKVLAMFMFMSLLWAMWSSSSFASFLGLLRAAGRVTAVEVASLIGLMALAVLLGTVGQWGVHKGFNLFVHFPSLPRSLAITILPLVLMAGLWIYHDKGHMTGELGEKFDTVARPGFNLRDRNQREGGYYQAVMARNDKEREAAMSDEKIKQRVDDVRGVVYAKNYRPTELWGARWSTNSYGMRDREYDHKKPAGYTRILITGASYVMGRGVADGETFEALTETHLGKNGAKVEMLNFAISASSSLQRMAEFDLRLTEGEDPAEQPGFDGDYLFVFSHPDEAGRNLRRLATMIIRGHDMTYPFIEEIITAEGITKEMEELEIRRRLVPYQDRIMKFIYERVADLAREHDITPVWVYLPLINDRHLSPADEGRAAAEAAGIKTVELHGVYGDYSIEELWVERADFHPNALGHRMIAARMVEVLRELGIADVPPLEWDD